jgi:hypothetical protein
MTFSNDHNFLMRTERTTILASLDSPRSPGEFGAKNLQLGPRLPSYQIYQIFSLLVVPKRQNERNSCYVLM